MSSKIVEKILSYLKEKYTDLDVRPSLLNITANYIVLYDDGSTGMFFNLPSIPYIEAISINEFKRIETIKDILK